MNHFQAVEHRVAKFATIALLGGLMWGGLVDAIGALTGGPVGEIVGRVIDGASQSAALGGEIRWNRGGKFQRQLGAVQGGSLQAYTCDTFLQDGARYLILKQKVMIQLGLEVFRSDQAVVRITKGKNEEQQNIEILLRGAQIGGNHLASINRVAFESKFFRIKAQVTGDIKVKQAWMKPSKGSKLKWVTDFVAEFAGQDGGIPKENTKKKSKQGFGRRGLFSGDGLLTFSLAGAENGGKISGKKFGKNEYGISLHGPLRLVYASPKESRKLVFTADRAVIILGGKTGQDLAKGKISGRSFSEKDIAGIYLEGDVMATDGDYTIRSPRVYYDLKASQGVIMDAVLNTWSSKLNQPIYIRAQKLRQHYANEWSGEKARIGLSAFAQSHVSVNAQKMIFTKRTGSDGLEHHRVKVQGASLGVNGWNVLPLPNFDTEIELPPVRKFQPGYSSNGGPTLETSWDLFSLFRGGAPENATLYGDLDILGTRGVGTGISLKYDHGDMFGKLDGYLLVADHGEDDFSGRVPIEHEGELRGFLQLEHRQEVEGGWELSVEYGYVSDPVYLERFERELSESGRAFDASIYLKHQVAQRAFTALASSNVNDFISQDGILQSVGYTVERKPQVALHVIGETVWDGRLGYFGNSSLSRMRIYGAKDAPEDRGYNNAQSARWLGIPNAATSFRDALRSQGIPMGFVNRFDSRHEFQAPLKAGILDMTPYFTGRLTAYDEAFESYGDSRSNVRLWAGAGVRIGTEFSKTFDQVNSSMLGIHGLRHIIEPRMDIHYSDSSIDRKNLPQYDVDIEGINDGLSTRLGMRQTLQTKRGGVGRQRVVDVLVVDTDVVFQKNAYNDNIVGRYFSYRPELSRGGDHFSAEVRWQASDRFGLAGNVVNSLEGFRTQQWALGASMSHTQGITSFVEYRDTDIIGSRFLTWGAHTQLTQKYELGIKQVIGFNEHQSRELSLTLVRKMPGWKMVLGLDIDQIRGDQTVFLVFYPQGMKSGRGESRLFKPWGE